jgi:hypothetical protein
MDKQKPEQKAFADRTEPRTRRKKKNKNFDVVDVVVGSQNSKKWRMNKAKHEGSFEDLTKKVVEHRYRKMHASQTSLLDLEAKYPQLAAALREIPPSFAFPMLDGIYLTKKAFHGILVNHQRGSRTSYVDNLVRRFRKRGKELSPQVVEILKIAELQGGFVTWDTMLKGLTLRLQLEARAQKETLESERNAIVERLREVGDSVEPSDLEPVDVQTVHASCKTRVTRGWRHKKRPANRAVNFLWALCPSCSTVLSLSEAELRPQLTT